MVVAVAWGSVSIPLSAFPTIMRALATGGPIGDPSLTTAYRIIALVRLPRVVTAAGAGAALGIAGLTMQTLFRNALAGPGVLGSAPARGWGWRSPCSAG